MTWLGIFRLGLVQATLGAVVVFTTVTLNRVMVIELAQPAILPGALVALHYAVQVLRPRLGHGSDGGGWRTPWIIGGVACLCLGGISAACATALMVTHLLAGILLAALSFAAVGIGVGAAGTTVLVIMAKQVNPNRRGAAATIVWVMMIFGIVVTAGATSHMLHPFSLPLLVHVAIKVAAAAFLVTCLAVIGVEQKPQAEAAPARQNFIPALREVWAEKRARRFTIFVFLSMLAYGAQELILEPFAGAVFALTPAETAGLTSLQHGGVMAGMILVGLATLFIGAGRLRAMRAFTIGGCIASALALLALAASGFAGPLAPIKPMIFALGVSNGAFAVSAISAMMALASQGAGQREGVRMGLWGAAQALAFGAGSLLSPATSDVFRALLGTPAPAYAAVFIGQATLFLAAATLAGGIFEPAAAPQKARGFTHSLLKEIAA
jgi:BCD family chlorophyll transporter-like MFS transporter